MEFEENKKKIKILIISCFLSISPIFFILLCHPFLMKTPNKSTSNNYFFEVIYFQRTLFVLKSQLICHIPSCSTPKKDKRTEEHVISGSPKRDVLRMASEGRSQGLTIRFSSRFAAALQGFGEISSDFIPGSPCSSAVFVRLPS